MTRTPSDESIHYGIPVLPGKEKAALAFGKEIAKQKKEFVASERRMKATKEAWFLQRSPKGSVIIVYFEAADPQTGWRPLESPRIPRPLYCEAKGEGQG